MALITAVVMFLFMLGSLINLLPMRKERYFFVSLALAGAGSLVIIGMGIFFLIEPMTSGAPVVGFKPLIQGFPAISVSLYADRLAAVFLIITGGLSLAAALHMADCLEGITDRSQIALSYNLFVLSIVLTVLANTVFFFLFSLECITLSYAYLVLYRHNRNIEKTDVPSETVEGAKTAFKSYLIFEHVASMVLVIALLLISIESSTTAVPDPRDFDFDVIRQAVRQNAGVSGPTASLVFLLALIGFAIKAGVFPTHIWVPLVHPFSPTSIHAMMSGIVLEAAGLYGMYRVFFEFIGPGQVWWGLLVLLLAGASALFGVFYATIGRDLKTALASHSIEHIGIILAGIGLALIYRWAAENLISVESTNSTTITRLLNQEIIDSIVMSFRMAEALALIASLYHLVNHSIFKSLLFFATGAIENRTGTTSLDRLGGLIKRYPWTSATFLIGAVSIAGLPPFNGFVSEWLTLQALFSGMNLFTPVIGPRIYLLLGMMIALLCLAMAFGITTLAFVKIAGEVLLGEPRDFGVARYSKPGEVSWRIRGVLVALAALCLVTGLLPGRTANGISQIAYDLSGNKMGNPLIFDGSGITIQLPVIRVFTETVSQLPHKALRETEEGYQARLSAGFLWLLAGMIASPFLARLGQYILRKRSTTDITKGSVWTGGSLYQPKTMQYTGSAFSSLIWMPFEAQKMPHFPKRKAAAGEAEEQEHIFITTEQLTGRQSVPEVFRFVYDYAIRQLIVFSQRVGDWAQPGDIRRYLLYIFVMFFLALAILLLLGAGGN